MQSICVLSVVAARLYTLDHINSGKERPRVAREKLGACAAFTLIVAEGHLEKG